MDSIETIGIEIVQDKERTAKSRNLFLPWLASNISAFGMNYGIWILSLGISFVQAIIISIIGVISSLVICGVIALGGKRGSVPIMVMSRAVFGVNGAKIPSAISWLISVGWETSSAITAVLATNTILARLGWAGDDSTVVKAIAAAIVAVLIVLRAVAGYHVIMKTQAVLTQVAGTTTIIYILLAFPHIDLAAIVTHSNGSLASMLGTFVMVMAGIGLGWVNITADWSRYQSRGTPGSQTVFQNTFGGSLGPVFLTSFGLMLAGSDEKLVNAIGGDSVGVLVTLLPTWFLAPFLITTILSFLSGAISGIHSSGLTLLTLGIRIPRPLASLIDSVIPACGIIYVTFFSPTFIGPFQSSLVTLGAPLAAWTGIMMADVILRKKDYDEEVLFTISGKYGSYNIIPLVILAVCCPIGWGLIINGFADAPLNNWQGYLLPLVSGKDGA